jgi:hypothetical protein
MNVLFHYVQGFKFKSNLCVLCLLTLIDRPQCVRHRTVSIEANHKYFQYKLNTQYLKVCSSQQTAAVTADGPELCDIATGCCYCTVLHYTRKCNVTSSTGNGAFRDAALTSPEGSSHSKRNVNAWKMYKIYFHLRPQQKHSLPCYRDWTKLTTFTKIMCRSLVSCLVQIGQ